MSQMILKPTVSMNNPAYYSVRMHASRLNAHVSGAERIVHKNGIQEAVSLLVARALSKGLQPDQVRISIDELAQAYIRSLAALDLVTVPVTDLHQGRSCAGEALLHAGVSRKAIDQAMHLLSMGPGPSGVNMRGAMLIDADSGERLEPDRSRGVRASRFDWTDQAAAGIEQLLAPLGLSHFRIREALALATKIAHGPFVAAELCWSDDPDYTAGYAASLATGYVRFPFMKETGSSHGGRAIFIRDKNRITELVSYLEREAVLIEPLTSCQSISSLPHYLKNRTDNHVRT